MKTVYLANFSVIINPGETQFLPYSSGVLWSYIQSCDDLKDRYNLGGLLFEKKSVDLIVNELTSPDIFGFSCYVWNANYNDTVASAVKQKYPNCLIIYGGPHLPQTKDDEWWAAHPYVDIVVYYEGEVKFADILRKDNLYDIAKLTNVCVNFKTHWTWSRVEGADRIKDLSTLPSPYEQNLFKTPLPNHNMLFETHRGCPYACTFCDWGSLTYTKLTKFNLDRIKAEIEWAGKNRVGFIYNVDANFGIFKERDHAIVDYLIETKKKYGYPKTIFLNFAKNLTEDMMVMTKKLYDAKLIKSLIMSLQTLTEDALVLTKRSNMAINRYMYFAEQCKTHGIPIACELILGNPGETIESWKNTYLTITELNHLSTHIYPLTLLPGAPMSTSKSRLDNEFKTVFNPFPGVNGLEIEEKIEFVTATKWLTAAEMKYLYEWTWTTRLGHEFNFLRDFADYIHTHNILSKQEFYDRWHEFVSSSTGVFNAAFQLPKKRIDACEFGIVMQSVGHKESLSIDKRIKAYEEIHTFVDQFDINETIKLELVKYCEARQFNMAVDYPLVKQFKYNFIDDIEETVTVEFMPTAFGGSSNLGQTLVDGSDAVDDNFKYRSGNVCTLMSATIVDREKLS